MVFCIMCCSSYITSPESLASLHSELSANLKSSNFKGGRGLLFDETISNKLNQHQHNLASPLSEDQNSNSADSKEEQYFYLAQETIKQQGAQTPRGALQLVKALISGELTYMTYMLVSLTCFFMWVTPNFNKLKKFFFSSSKASSD